LEKAYRPHKNLVAQNRELEPIRETRDKWAKSTQSN
ncbi:unnamed protein product, partial [Rotaria socialis]